MAGCGVDVINDDLEILELIEYGVPYKTYIRSNYFEELDDSAFYRRFRLTKDTTRKVLSKVDAEIETAYDRNNSVSAINQLLLTLRFYATGEHLLSIADFAGMHVATVSKIIEKVTGAIARLRADIIKFPETPVELEGARADFYKIASFPNIVGAVDGTHVRIQSPGGDDAEVYRNRKKYFSINVQAISNANLEFIDIVARWPGSTHDSTIFNNCTRKHKFEDREYGHCFLLGDSGYAAKNYLLTPLLNPTTQAEQLYNEAHIRTRAIVEKLFGVWKRRFPIMAYGSRLKLSSTYAMVVATAVLHNVARRDGDVHPPPVEDDESFQRHIAEGDIRNFLALADGGENGFAARRELILDYFARL